MPEGDTIFRAARTLDRALAGRTVIRFESVFAQLNRVDRDRPLQGRTVERVTPRGKHLLIWFAGELILHTHMRMHGSWHLYHPEERWQLPHSEMRIVIGTEAWNAVAFNVPIAEFIVEGAANRGGPLQWLGPDLLGADCDTAEAVRRLEALSDVEVGDALLDQQALAGVGNIYKSETLFLCGISPFTRVVDLPRDRLERIVATARRLMRAHALEAASAPRWVYGRGGRPCRRCGTVIGRRPQGRDRRSTYWCPRCQRTGWST